MNPTNQSHLLLIAHGSRSPVWNAAMEEFVSRMREVNKAYGFLFSDVSCGYLEHAEPSIPDALHTLSKQSNRVIVIPFFLTPGVHVQRDVPERVKSVGTVIQENQTRIHVQCNESDIYLIPHYSEAELLAQNALHRINQFRNTTGGLGLILVYYGSKRHPEIWDELSQKVEMKIKHKEPGIQMKSVYAGDAVAFSPQPTLDAISALSLLCSRVMILPMLLAVGVIQTEVIPKAIGQSEWRDNVIYHQDSVLPDHLLAEEIWKHARYHMHYISI